MVRDMTLLINHTAKRWPAAACALLLAALLLSGCSPESYRRSADKEVYGILKGKTPAVPGMVEDFSIEQTERNLLRDCPLISADEAPVEMQTASAETPLQQNVPVVSLSKALEIAAFNSREYQTQKESLYRSALSLTLQRYDFMPQFFGIFGADYDNTDLGDDEEVSGSSDFGFGWLLRTGTRISVSLGTSVSQFLTHDPRKSASSVFDLTVTQPLLQGAGIAVTEPLTQAERDVIYRMREFVRFRRRFFVDVLSDYYSVLRERQILENELLNYEGLQLARERAELLGQAGDLPGFEVDQTRQDELRAADRVQSSRQSYRNRLDQFKVTLGLAPETALVLDPAELDRLSAAPGEELQFEAGAAVRVAIVRRLDLATATDRLEDARRKVQVAENDLLPGLDLSASLSTDTEGDNNPTNFQADRTDLSAGLELDLPLDKKSERNEYRRRLIDLDEAVRDQCEARDEVVLQVRNSWRQLTRARRSYQIREQSVRLAEARVESTMLLLEAGDADTRDMLEAREALVGAQNDLARALVDYRVARLQLARDMEILNVTRTGQLAENFDEYIGT
ncbi:MAG: TolC family protein [Candidatus Brocadiia bacterium]